MSTLVVETIKHTNDTTLFASDTSGQLTVQGEGTATTNLQGGLAKAWAHTNGSSGTPSLEDSFNMSSITDMSTGRYQHFFTNAMVNDNYAVPTSVNSSYLSIVEGYATASFQFRISSSLGSITQVDRDNAVSATFGDLA